MKLLTLAISLLASASLSAATTWTLQSKEYQVDTLYHATVGPGTTQTSLSLTGGSNLKVFYTVTDLTHPNVEMRVVMAGDKYSACNTVSSMAIGKTTPTEQYFTGVNADFFGNLAPIGSTVVNNEIYNLSNNGWTTWAMVNDHTPVANEMTFTGTVTSPASSHPLSGVNVDRYTNYLVIYTSRKAATTGTNIYGYEVALKPVGSTPVMFGKTKYTVTTAPSSAGSMAIPAGQVVLSGNGTADLFVKSLNIGDEITVDMELVNGNDRYSSVSQMAGGKPMIVSGGQVLDTQGALDHLTALNPRTAIGYNADGTKLIMLVVDGRSSASVGVVSRQLADMMIQLGCTEAMNFDGGGSSALYVKELGVRNTPSDGKERAVTNGVYAVSVAPVDNEVAALEFEQKKISLPRYCYYSPRVYAYNKYGVLIDADYKGYTLSCPQELGSVTADGSQLFTNGSGYHALTASVNGVSASVPVEVSAADPRLRLDSAIVDPFNPYLTEVVALVDDSDIPVDNSAITWTTDDSAVATVNENGLVEGVAKGETIIRGTVDNIAMALPVTVEVPEKRYLDIYPADTEFSNAKSGVKDVAVTVADGVVKMDFTISSTRSPYLEIQADAKSYAIPDSLLLKINPGTATVTSVYVGYLNQSGRKATKTYNVEFPTNELSVMKVPVSDIVDVTDRANFPLNLTGLRFYFSGTSGSTHSIEIPAYQFVYDNVKNQNGVESVVADTQFDGNIQFSVNPVAPGETVGINTADPVLVYSISGELVLKADGNSFTAPAVSGVYVVKAGNKSGKLIVK